MFNQQQPGRLLPQPYIASIGDTPWAYCTQKRRVFWDLWYKTYLLQQGVNSWPTVPPKVKKYLSWFSLSGYYLHSHSPKFTWCLTDPNIRVAALTCMGAVVTIHAPLMEVSHILLPPLRQEDGSECDAVVVSSILHYLYIFFDCTNITSNIHCSVLELSYLGDSLVFSWN